MASKSYPLTTLTQIGKTAKKQGVWGSKHTQQVILRTNFPLFGLQHATTSTLSTHPLFALCPPLWWCTLCQEHSPRQQATHKDKGGRQEVCFVHQPTIIEIFFVITDNPYYNVVRFLLISIFFFQVQSDKICYYHTVFYLLFLVCFFILF